MPTKVSRRQWRLAALLGLVMYAVFITFAWWAWVQTAHDYQDLALTKSSDVLVLRQEREILKEQLRRVMTHQPAIIITVDANSRIDVPVTPQQTIVEFIGDRLPGLASYISAEEFYRMSAEYSIDAGFALATFVLETGWGKSDAWLKQNNPAGLTCNGSYCVYKSKRSGIEQMFELMQAYVDGRYSWISTRRTVEDVRQKWSTSEDTHKIVELWNQILKGE